MATKKMWSILVPFRTEVLSAFAQVLVTGGPMHILFAQPAGSRGSKSKSRTRDLPEGAKGSIFDLEPGRDLPDFDLALLDETGLEKLFTLDRGEESASDTEASLPVSALSEATAIGLVLASAIEPMESRLPDDLPHERCFGIRPVRPSGGEMGLEIVRLPATTPEVIDHAVDWARAVGMPFATLDYDAPGGVLERIIQPVQSEAWRMVREGAAPPQLIDRISVWTLGCERGILSQVRGSTPVTRGYVAKALAAMTLGDARFRTFHDQYPAEGALIWSSLEEAPQPLCRKEGSDDSGQRPPKSVLIVGTPHLVRGWREAIYERTVGKVNAEQWQLWEIASVSDEDLEKVESNAPYELVLECLIAPVDERQRLLELVRPHVSEKGQVWVHTLNMPSTITVQVLPPDIDSVGFGGMPPLWDTALVELARPASSETGVLDRAGSLAVSLGLEPYEVADEPGGVGARLLSILINSTVFTVRDGVISSLVDADRAAQRAMNMPVSPLRLADTVGLDLVEAVIVGLEALLGEDRYRVCPDITLRIESGMVGASTGRGYYLP